MRDHPWIDDLLLAETPDDLYWWQQNADVDPAPDLGRLRLPVLLFYGADDTVVPPADNAARLVDLLHGARPSLLVFPRGNHRGEVPAGPDVSGRWRLPRMAPGMEEAIGAWLLGLASTSRE